MRDAEGAGGRADLAAEELAKVGGVSKAELVSTWASQGKNLVYDTIHKVIADGELVLTQSEGRFGNRVAYYDLFRVQAGKIVEHWDVIAPIPSALPHSNGLF